jgi:hypothetical protein
MRQDCSPRGGLPQEGHEQSAGARTSHRAERPRRPEQPLSSRSTSWKPFHHDDRQVGIAEVGIVDAADDLADLNNPWQVARPRRNLDRAP